MIHKMAFVNFININKIYYSVDLSIYKKKPFIRGKDDYLNSKKKK